MLLEINKYKATVSGIELKELADTRVALVELLRDREVVNDGVLTEFLLRNNAVARYAFHTKEQLEHHFNEDPSFAEFDYYEGYMITGKIQFNYLYCHSKVAGLEHPLKKYLDFVDVLEKPIFKTLTLDKYGNEAEEWNRKYDTEARILEEIYKSTILHNDMNLLIEMYTKFEPCKSCEGVMEQFTEEMNKRGINLVMNVYYQQSSSNNSRLRRRGAKQRET